MMPGSQSDNVRVRLAIEQYKLARTDFVHHSHEIRAILQGLLEGNPGNTLARNYLLCYDLLNYDLDRFIEDYTPLIIKAHIYQEAVLIWLSQNNRLTEQEAARFGIDATVANRMNSFYRNPEKFSNTYWYYYLNALQESDR